MTELNTIQSLLEEIREVLIQTQTQRTAARDVMVVSGLSDVSEKLGLVQAGEFRVGNSKEPGFGFTGVRIGYPPFSYISQTWNVAGVNNDVLMFGLSATDGKAYFAAGSAVIDSAGLTFTSGDYPATRYIRWKTSTGEQVGGISGWTSGGTLSGIEVAGRRKNSSYHSQVYLLTEDESGVSQAILKVDGRGQIYADVRAGSQTGQHQQAFLVQGKSSVTNDATTLLYLDAYNTGTPANGFGPLISFRAQTPAGGIITLGYLIIEYTDTTAGSEDSKMVAGYLVNGVLTEKVLAP